MTDESDPRALLEAATKRPWQWWTSNSHCRLGTLDRDGNIAHGYSHPVDGVGSIEISEADAALIVWAVNHLERLLEQNEYLSHHGFVSIAECDRLRAELKESRAAEARLREALTVASAALSPEATDAAHVAFRLVKHLAQTKARIDAALSASDGGGGRDDGSL
jgi:hypothetical protein